MTTRIETNRSRLAYDVTDQLRDNLGTKPISGAGHYARGMYEWVAIVPESATSCRDPRAVAHVVVTGD